MKIAIIIVNFNGLADTRECLASLNKSVLKDVELETIVVDNASKDTSVTDIKREFPGVTLLVNTDNLGFAEGNNVGIRYALKRSSDFIFLLNNDTYVAADTVAKLYDAALAHKSGGIFCPKIYFAPGCETHPDRYKTSDLGKVIWYAGGLMDWQNVLASHRGVDEVDTGKYDEMTKTSFASGCAMFLRREVFETVGLFDAKFYLYYEDLDLAERAHKKGYDIYYVPAARVWHKNARTSGGSGSDLQSYYITRNRLLVGMRYAPWRTKLALFREALNLIANGTKTQRFAIGDFLRKKYGKRETKSWIPRMPNLLKYFRKNNKGK